MTYEKAVRFLIESRVSISIQAYPIIHKTSIRRVKHRTVHIYIVLFIMKPVSTFDTTDCRAKNSIIQVG